MTNSTTDISAMKKLMQTYIFNLIAAVALLSGMASCTDDTDMPQAIDDGTTSITLRIPNPESAAEFARSRAATGDPDPSQNAEEGEGAIKSLWLLAYPTDGTESVVRKLLSSGQVTNEYSDYKITIKPGDYRLYVVANLDSYITDHISATTDEEELKSLVLNFSPKKLPNLTDGLPMACLPSEIDEAGNDGTVAIAPGDNKTVHADMTFLCAKVRYTIKFDNSDGGFSRPAFGDNTVTFHDGSLSGVIASTSLTAATTTTEEAFKIDPAPLAPVETTPNTRSWQGTVYLPENLLSGKDRTLLHLNATLDINNTPLSYTIPLPSPDADKETAEAKTLQRGHFYDLVGKVTSLGDKLDLTAEVKDWTLLTLTYDLHGPYFLHVEKTAVEIYAGIETLIPYDTDAGQLTFTSEKYPDSVKDPGVTIPDGPLDLLVCTTVERDGKQYISVNVNPAIPAENRQLENRYFDIHAANLTKRINATIVSLKPFLNVTPQLLNIDVREIISSGIYTGTVDITSSTNQRKISISESGAGWDDEAREVLKFFNGADPISFKDEQILELSGSEKVVKMEYKNLNSGISFWNKVHNLELKVTALDNDGNPVKDESGNDLYRIVTINVTPFVQDYKIHLRVSDSWGDPHIYVYQCLELPSNLTGTNAQWAGMTVGANTTSLSALEYSFTGKVAFRGWYSDSNNDPTKPGSRNDKNGFFYFDETGENAIGSITWNPRNDINNIHYYTNIDFCKNYRNSSLCPCTDCKGSGYNLTWPGIAMYQDPENPGWWTFILTGIAEPGRALIMFSNGHGNEAENSNRFPGDGEVGIPLFDYPNREGWLDYAGGSRQFTNTKPGNSTPFEAKTYRIYWYKDPATHQNYRDAIHYQINDIDYYSQSNKSEQYNGNERFYYDVTIQEGQTLKAQAYNWTSSGNYYPTTLSEINSNNSTVETGKSFNYSYQLY